MCLCGGKESYASGRKEGYASELQRRWDRCPARWAFSSAAARLSSAEVLRAISITYITLNCGISRKALSAAYPKLSSREASRNYDITVEYTCIYMAGACP